MASTLFICGMPGSGKSTTGRKLAAKLKWKFYDLDDYILRFHGKSAATMIRENGEACFRTIESETLRDMDLSMNCIVSCGGGTPCFNDNLEWMQANGTCMFINMPLKALEVRIKQGAGFDMRPLISDQSKPVNEILEDLWKEREPYFRKIEWWVEGLEIKTDELAEEVAKQNFSD